MNGFMQDLKFAFRSLRRSPGFTAVAVATLALGIGANTAIFSVVNSVLLRPLPFPKPDRLVQIFGTHSKLGENRRALSYPDFADLERDNEVFAGVAGYTTTVATLSGGGQAEHLAAAIVSAGTFATLGVAPAIGRGFLSGEDRPGNHVAVLSDGLWHDRFGADPSVVGRTVELNGRPYRVVGVMPRGFRFPIEGTPARLWTTFSALAEPASASDSPVTFQRGAHFMSAIGRLKPGATIADADRSMRAEGAALTKRFPDSNRFLGLRAESAMNGLVEPVRAQILVLLAAVGVVLLIASANIAHLLLARSSTRRREFAVRGALGAGRGRIARQLIVESVVIGLGGAALGLVLGMTGTSALSKLSAADIPRLADASVDTRVLLFTFLIAVGAGLLAGIVPAFQLSRRSLAGSLRERSRGAGAAGGRDRTRNVLVVAEVALAVVLLTAAGLLVQSLVRLQNAPLGFDPDRVLVFSVDLPSARYGAPGRSASRLEEIRGRVGRLPGVQSASFAAPLPLSDDIIRTSFEIEGRTTAPGETPRTYIEAVGQDYFQTMRIRLIRGRGFTPADRADTEPVVVVDETLADRYFPGVDPIGRRIKPGISAGPVEPMRRIIGIAAAVKHLGLAHAPEALTYIPEPQLDANFAYFVVRAPGDPARLAPILRREVASLDPNLPVYAVRPLDDYVRDSSSQERMSTSLLGSFAALALVLALVGIAGLLSYSVTQRIGEIGVRLALGARPGRILRMILAEGIGLAGAGVALGAVGAFLGTRALGNMLFEVRAGDPTTILAVAALILLCAAAASGVPAFRASRVDPMESLRAE